MPADVAPNEWECRIFIAVAEHRNVSAAAKHLAGQIDGPYGSRSVSKVIRKIEDWCRDRLFEGAYANKQLTPKGEEFLERARAVVAEYQLMRSGAPVAGEPALACFPHHVHLVSRAHLLHRTAAGGPAFTVDYLHQRHRRDQAFHDHVVQRLKRDSYRLIIGPPVADDPSVLSRELYQARLEAMMPAAYPDPGIWITDLIRDHDLIVPTEEFRCRRLLEERIIEWNIPDPRRRTRIVAEDDDVTTSILRLRNSTDGDGPVVVVPSDVALVFRSGWEFGGRGADRFRWVPVRHQVGARVEELRAPVYVTTKRPANRLFGIVQALKAAVAELPELSGRDRSRPAGRAAARPRSRP
jgi:DNA-binding transcriptional LysR family regulator